MLAADWVRRRREVRHKLHAEAHGLLAGLGEGTYPEARKRARGCRERRDRTGERFWSRVAVEIAARTGRTIGERTADRYEAARGEV